MTYRINMAGDENIEAATFEELSEHLSRCGSGDERTNAVERLLDAESDFWEHQTVSLRPRGRKYKAELRNLAQYKRFVDALLREGIGFVTYCEGKDSTYGGERYELWFNKAEAERVQILAGLFGHTKLKDYVVEETGGKSQFA